MKVSTKWLKQYVNLSTYENNIQGLADLLTSAGLEVEDIEEQAKQYSSIMVGSILEKEQHPDADRLSVCQVNLGDGVVQQIVCGAKNHKAGDSVVVACPGAVLPNGLEIKAAKLRGVESNGMLCSEKELALSEEGSGIMILPADAPIGKDFADYYHLNDTFFELKVTPNRADCLSHYGLAREIASLLRSDIQEPEIQRETWSAEANDMASLLVEDNKLCPRYAFRTIKNVKVGESPAWLKQRLEGLGLNSINNVVDVTNYVMLELGQPLHAFDLSFLEGASVRVATSKRGESFVSLDGSEYTLDGSELMIYDAKKPVALAGVVGGKNSGVSEETKDLFIECAYFVPQTVRKTARKLGIETDAAYRFSRGVDPANMLRVLDRTCYLIQQVAGGLVSEKVVDIYPEPIQTATINCNIDFISQKLGYAVDVKEWEDILTALNCEWTKTADTDYMVHPPLYRHDLAIVEDLVEEYARVQGYDKIPDSEPYVNGAPLQHITSFEQAKEVRSKLSDMGFREALNYAFTSQKFEDKILGDLSGLQTAGLSIANDAIKIRNPLSEEYNIMRMSLVPGLFKNVMHNYRRGLSLGRYFEIGHVFSKNQNQYQQQQHLAMMAWGNSEGLWSAKQSPLILDLKARLENLLTAIGVEKVHFEQESIKPAFLHPGQSAIVQVAGQSIGYIGSFHPTHMQHEKIQVPLACAELDLAKMYQLRLTAWSLQAISPYPGVERDLAFVCDKDLAVGKILDYILDNFSPIKSAQVFDVYQGNNLAEGKKSIGIRMSIENPEKTMEEEELLGLQAEIIEKVCERFGAATR